MLMRRSKKTGKELFLEEMITNHLIERATTFSAWAALLEDRSSGRRHTP